MTPWGVADRVTEVAPGIVAYSTPSHGGLRVSPERWAEMPAALRRISAESRYHGGERWFEEDCEWAAVAVAFPSAFEASELESARGILRSVYPDAAREVLS